ncbi:hypothetical protein QO010_002020 [Caulobacter ginsengisoli]|uniref:Uncharacterized protein n=1 Tax=Caulobacter ginsengisoli TaxID=400775 RepID=A0ABU0IQK1_9CAUL|nr:hypothetical protein [Caulobacter ginsengisoli]MDQ0464239.1 hypothetical protein [Caulobacter ginsengisoli]
MRGLTKMGLAAAALGLGTLGAGAAGAQDFGSNGLRQAGAEGQSVALRWSLPLGVPKAQAAPKVALRFSQTGDEGQVRSLDLASLSFGQGGAPRISTPFALNAADDGDGGWFEPTSHKVLFAVGAGLVIWGVVEATQDDDNPPPSPPPPPPPT